MGHTSLHIDNRKSNKMQNDGLKGQNKLLKKEIEILRKERDWLDMDTAPDDGTRLMLFAGIDKINSFGEFFAPHRVVGYWCGQEECWFAHSYMGQPMVKLRPHKWQHLPPFPKMVG